MIPSKTKVSAFTIMEMTVAMLIAAIVIGITYTAYAIVSKSYTGFKTKNDDIAVLDRVDQLLRRDIGKAELISRSGSGLMVRKSTQTVSYEFYAGYIVRNSGVIDTFKVNTHDLKTTFEGIAETDQGLIDELSFTVSFQAGSIPYHYHKTYSSADLIQRNTYASH